MPSGVTDAVVIERLETFLTKQHKPVCEQSNSSISFHSPLWEDWLKPNWLALVIYDHGNFWIDTGLEGRVLRYDLRSWHSLIFCLAGALMFLVLVSSSEGIATGLRFSLLSLAWLYGGNMFLAWARIPLAIGKVVRGG